MKKYLSSLRLLSSLFTVVAFSCSPLSHANNAKPFSLSEYWAAGQKVTLQFNTEEPAKTDIPLHLKNSLTLNYADIISLGDLYGILGRPISHGIDEKQRQRRFKDVFDSFAKAPLAVHEVSDLNAVIKEELQLVETGIRDGEPAEEIYQRIGNSIGREINCITGGGCAQYGWWLYPGRYLLLALEDFDHFSPNNIVVYTHGHQLALAQALKAKHSGNRSDLEQAYAMEAFAAHYLSDQFTAGHLRTPREELNQVVSPAVLGSLLASYMHQEENKYGIHVRNASGVQWVVYGDTSYFNPLNQVNRNMLLAALQESADELFATYYTGIAPEHFVALDMIPFPEPFYKEDNLDLAPMFYWDDKSKQLWRRVDLSNPYDKHWTNSWWGWSTLVLLKNQYGISSTHQLSLTQYLKPYIPAAVKDDLLGSDTALT
ncbi:phospholipase [Legionella sp. km772]|uniref:phospholipase n=1 Tax=Legionella sp. km772 TaxID=2498111 RepID=UPI000F8C88EB|nr:phospholipase [Legionella sp. km772]RUR13645.1 phospholipase [Legionella sp. km772]